MDLQSSSTAAEVAAFVDSIMQQDDCERSALCVYKCQICENETLSRNYGVYACRACAAFFRRTYAQRKEYRCRRSKSCLTNVRRNVHGKLPCSYCRFIRCLEVGMRPINIRGNDIEAPLGSSVVNNTPLHIITTFRQALFLRRVQCALSLGLKPQPSDTLASKTTVMTGYPVEMKVMYDYFSTSESVLPYLSGEWNVRAVSEHFFPVWVFFENLMCTAQNAGHSRRQLHLTDGTFILITPSAVEEFWRSMPEVTDPATVAVISNDVYTEIFAIIEGFRLSDFNEFELSTMFRLLFAHYESSLFSTPASRKQFVNDVVRDLASHGSDTDADFAVALGRITTLIGEFHKAYRLDLELNAALDVMAKYDGSYCCVDGYRRRKEIEN